ncbi:MAG: helix-turn-helix domain-containing protein [Alphaproteobacteria bacterium]|nr:helix-turn-helix domain-containing protein [Alphaproteobacteria bacterium]
MSIDSYKEIGAVLQRARLDMGLTLRQVGTQIHIRAHYLEALEQGNIQKLPGLPYARGFLSTYVTFLGLDKDEMMRRFEAVEGVLSRPLRLPEVFSKEKSPTPNIVWGSLSGALVLYVFWLLAFKPAPAPMDVASFAPPVTQKVEEDVLLEDACFHDVKRLYPPCHAARIAIKPSVDGMYPPRGQIVSVMELAEKK